MNQMSSFSEKNNYFDWKSGPLIQVCPTMEATEKICKQIGPLMNTFYGGMWQIVQNNFNVYKDTAYTNESMGIHTDNTYARDPAG